MLRQTIIQTTKSGLSSEELWKKYCPNVPRENRMELRVERFVEPKIHSVIKFIWKED